METWLVWLMVYLSGCLMSVGMLITFPSLNAGSVRRYATLGTMIVFLGPPTLILAAFGLILGIFLD